MKYYLSICAIAQNESFYLDEWILFHKGLGVDHIYLYENDSIDMTYDKAKKHEPYVSVEKIHGRPKQAVAYIICLENYKNESRWIAFIDVDEFVVPHDKNIKDILSAYESYPAFCAHWYLFGDSGHKYYQQQPVVERFTMREKEVNRHVKSFVDPKRTGRFVTAHKFAHTPYGKAVDENFVEIDDLDSLPENPTANKVQINHYITKSEEESWIRRASPGASRADIVQVRKMPEFYEAHNHNEIEDLRALDLWRSIK